MKKYLIIILLFQATHLFSQQKYALISSYLASATEIEKKTYRNDFKTIYNALIKQDFKPSQIYFDTINNNRKSIIMPLTQLKNQLKQGDFVFIYIDHPIRVETTDEDELSFMINEKEDEYISFRELSHLVSDLKIKVNDPNLIFTFIDAEFPFSTKSSFNYEPTSNHDFEMGYITSGRPGEANLLHRSNTSIFAMAIAASINPNSVFLNSNRHLYSSIEKYVLLNTTVQHPMVRIPSGSDKLFNGLFKKYPNHFNIVNRIDDSTFEINCGQNLNITYGNLIKIYKSEQDTIGGFIDEGKVINSKVYSSIVRCNKSITKHLEEVWVYIGENNNTITNYQVSFSTCFADSANKQKKKLFDALLLNLKNSSISKNLTFKSKGADLAIGNIEIISPQLFNITIADAQGWIYKTIQVTNINNLDKLNQLITQHSKWQYLSKLSNNIPQMQINLTISDNENGVEKENGYDIFYTGRKYELELKNENSTILYYAIIDMQPDKYFNVMSLGYDYFYLKPNESKRLTLEFTPPFGIERFKIISSYEPIILTGFDNGSVPTRGKSEAFRPEFVNIQNYDFEIRSSIFAKSKNDSSRKRIKSDYSKSEITFQNPFDDRIYFNVLRQRSDGGFDMLLPNNKHVAVDCYILDSATFAFDSALNNNDQVLTIYSDRAFSLSDYAKGGKDLNDLILEIHRMGKIDGSPLNKIFYSQQIYSEETTTLSRGNELQIRLLTPKVSLDRGNELLADRKELNLIGFACTQDNKPVSVLKINGNIVTYDSILKYFDETILLEPGRNKIIIEAFDAKGFSSSKILEFVLQKNESIIAGKGKNYFLGIGIDKYQSWPQLNNAKNDILKFEAILESKYGFEKPDVTLLLDSAATRKAIINAIRTYLSKVKPNDNVIIYLSGHGNEDQLVDGGYYFIPQDADIDDVSSAVKSSDIIDNFKMIKALHCLLIVDACYSGMITNNINIPKPKITSANEQNAPDEMPSKWIITSGRATKVSDGKAGQNSPFAALLINYLRENDTETMLRMSLIIDYLMLNVPKTNSTQIPVGVLIDGEGESFFKVKH